MNIIEAKNIVKNYSGHLALDNLNLAVKGGSIFGLLGPNGAGKTTFIRTLNQITAPDSGEILFNGEKLNQNHIAQIGYLPEERGLYKKMGVGEQALYLAQLKGISKSEAKKKLDYWFEKFDITSWWDKKVEELSKGMAQKVQFIITILHDPKLLIFDEPFSGFDPINTNLIKKEILELRDKGATIIFSTHNMGSVEEICDHIALINNSKKILDGEINEVRDKFKSNIFEIQFRGEFNKMQASLSHNYEILDLKEETSKIITLKIQLLNGTTNEIISTLLPTGNIMSFNEVIPSMNDIFIQAVNEAQN